jgi:hypothetical protein
MTYALIESEGQFDDVYDNTPLMAAVASMLRSVPSRTRHAGIALRE